MRAPPATRTPSSRSIRSVRYPLGPERRWQLLLSAAFLLLLLTEVTWWSAHRLAGSSTGWLMLVAALLVPADIALARAFWRLGTPAARLLAWTGQTWQLLDGAESIAPATVGKLSVVLDLGDGLLLRHRSVDRRTTWLAVGASASPRHWHALRVALADSRRRGTEARHDGDAA